MDSNGPSIITQVKLLSIGALISLITTLVTDCQSRSREDERNSIQKRLELNQQISKDLGKRLYWTFDIYKKKRDKDSTYASSLQQYKICKEEWNLNIFSYESLLEHYYDEDIRNEFIRNVYNPLIALGINAEILNLPESPEYNKKFNILRKNTSKFIAKIYKESRN